MNIVARRRRSRMRRPCAAGILACSTRRIGAARSRRLVGVGMLALAAYGLWRLEFSFCAFRVRHGAARRISSPSCFRRLPGRSSPSICGRSPRRSRSRFLGTLMAAVLAFPLGFLAAKNVDSQCVRSFRRAPLARHDPRRRRADLGADLDQCGRPRPVRRHSRHRSLRHRQLRQTVLRGDRKRRQEAGRRRHCDRRLAPECRAVRPDSADASRSSQARSSTISSRTRAPRRSSALSGRAASACTCRSRSACWNGARSLSWCS